MKASSAMSSRPGRIVHLVLVLVAILFGAATLMVGTRVLSGHDPGYVVFRPLLLYNVAMGFAYIAAGVVAWRKPGPGSRAALAIFLLNLLVLVAIAWLRSTGEAVAAESVGAMGLRTGVWLLISLGLTWIDRRAQ